MASEAYNIDCMEYMRSLPDNAFDLAVVDPPYGDAGGWNTSHIRNPKIKPELCKENGTDSGRGSTGTRRQIPRTGFHGKNYFGGGYQEQAALGRLSTAKKL